MVAGPKALGVLSDRRTLQLHGLGGTPLEGMGELLCVFGAGFQAFQGFHGWSRAFAGCWLDDDLLPFTGLMKSLTLVRC